MLVRPRVDLLRTALLSYLFLSVPLFGTLYFLSVPDGPWNITLVFHLLTVAVAGVAFIRYRRSYVGVTSESLEARGFFSRLISIPLTDLHSAVLVETYRGSSEETVYQLLLTGVGGRRMLRMRSTFWHESTMGELVATLGVPITERTDAMTTKAFLTEFPASAYWFENRPAVAILAAAGGLIVILGIVLGLMAIINVPMLG